MTINKQRLNWGVLLLLVCQLFSFQAVQAAKPAVKKTPFGDFNNQQVHLYTLSNSNGMHVSIMNYGATVTSIILPDAHGNSSDIAAGFNQFDSYFSDEYVNNAPYFGGIIGRYASFIKNSEFSLEGKKYQLAKNLGQHHLHGGKTGFDKKLWQVLSTESQPNQASIKLYLLSKDGDEAYPGNVKVTVTYTLTNTNELAVHYSATTDKATPLSLTNHTYFNLNGFTDDVLQHEVQINSDAYLTPDEAGMPNGALTPVKGTGADFTQKTKLAKAFEKLPQGFEHFYVFDNPKATLRKIAHISEPTSGRSMTVYSTEPSTLFYTARYTSDKLAREDGARYGKFRAFCVETSKYPNGPNIEGSPRTTLQPDDVYNEKTVFKFSW